ncbi:MAG: hypothetical protein IPG74_00485 [Flavobacteriales bacterium]|nr:hypothetical protein [Flavobacteriales bacterium]
MKLLLIATITACTLACAQPCQAQNKPLFEGAEVLDSCLVELPLTYAKKDKERYTQAARYLRGAVDSGSAGSRIFMAPKPIGHASSLTPPCVAAHVVLGGPRPRAVGRIALRHP